MATAAELVQTFDAARASPIGDIGERLVALCETAQRALAERGLADALDDRALVTALAEHAPERGPLEYLEHCRIDELALAVAACRGNAQAIDAIERDHDAALDAVCWRYANATHTAADLRQILREKLYVAPAGGTPKLAEYAGSGQLESWLRITAVRTFLDLGKRKDRNREASSDERALAMPDPDDLSLEVIKAEYRAAVRQALHDAAAELEPADRHVLHQHFVAGLTIDQLGVALGIHRATAARRVVRARETLVAATRALLATRLRLADHELDEVIGMVMSRLDVSIPRLLRPIDPTGGHAGG